MAKLPFIPFYPDAWLRDTRKLHPLAKAVWIDILCIAWNEPQRGVYHRTYDEMFRELGITKHDWDYEVAKGICQVAEVVEEQNGHVMVISRRMAREEKARELNRNRVDRFRKKQECNGLVTVEKLEVRSKKLEEEEKKKAFTPPTLEEVREYVQAKGYNIDPEHFWNHYETRGWVPKGYTRKMTSWKSAVNTWVKMNRSSNGSEKPDWQ